MSFVRYKIGQQEQFIQFDQFFNSHRDYFEYIVEHTCSKWEKGLSPIEPLVTISILPPKDNEQWDCKHIFKQRKQIIIYSKRKNNKIYAYFQCIWLYNQWLIDIIIQFIVKTIFLNMMFNNKNLLYFHGMVLSNGDVVCAPCCSGKTTLMYRLNNTNKYLKSLCDDGVLIDFQKKLVYPLPYFFPITDGKTLVYEKEKNVDISKPYSLHNIFTIEKNGAEQEQIKQIDKEQWLKILYTSAITFYHHPFKPRYENEYITRCVKWIDYRKQLYQQAISQLKEKIKLLDQYKPLVLVTNTTDLNKKFEVLPDA